MAQKTFEDLKASEIRKAEKLANKFSGRTDCKVTGWFSENHDFEWFYKVTCEICYNYETRASFDVVLFIDTNDRRRTTAHVPYGSEYIQPLEEMIDEYRAYDSEIEIAQEELSKYVSGELEYLSHEVYDYTYPIMGVKFYFRSENNKFYRISMEIDFRNHKDSRLGGRPEYLNEKGDAYITLEEPLVDIMETRESLEKEYRFMTYKIIKKYVEGWIKDIFERPETAIITKHKAFDKINECYKQGDISIHAKIYFNDKIRMALGEIGKIHSENTRVYGYHKSKRYNKWRKYKNSL